VFIELCPPEVVQEHMRSLGSNLTDTIDEEVVDVDPTDVTDR
jgi:hypothetical protein